jgi:AcrR family transcriptional regulator
MDSSNEERPTKRVGDGRNARRHRSKAAVISATHALIYELETMPSAQQVASRANVSLRLVYDLFNDMDTLISAVAAQQAERLFPLMRPLNTHVSLEERCLELVEQRLFLYEEIAPFRRAVLERQRTHPSVPQLLGGVQTFKREQVWALFAKELHSIEDPDEREEVRAALAVITSFSAWDALVRQQKRSNSQIKATMLRMLRAVLAPYKLFLDRLWINWPGLAGGLISYRLLKNVDVWLAWWWPSGQWPASHGQTY